MNLKIDGVEYSYPESVMTITLQDRISFDSQHGKLLRDQLHAIHEIKGKSEKEIEYVVYHCELAKRTLEFFARVPADILELLAIEDIMIVYDQLLSEYSQDTNFSDEAVILQNHFTWNKQEWEIQAPALVPESIMTFGEFIDAKQSVQDLFENNDEKYAALLSLCCIFFRKKGEPYTKELSREKGERWELLKELPLPYALQVGFFFERLSKYVQDYFPVFWEGRTKGSGRFVNNHMKEWGWVNLLKEVAITKIFDTAGHGNSIDCARAAKCFDVLVLVSEDRLIKESEVMDYESKNK